VSFAGHQLKIVTDDAFMKARIRQIDCSRILSAVNRGQIAVIAGFQGVTNAGDVTTLGRGGSDTTAVAVAAAIRANACEIFTDVDGVYTTDPAVCSTARKVPRITYEEMLELASLGAKVLQIRSVEIAMKYGVPVHVRNSFNDATGTWVVGEDAALEDVVVAGVAYEKNEARVEVLGLPDRRGLVAELFGALAEQNILVDMIVQDAATPMPSERRRRGDVTFTVTKLDLARHRSVIEGIAKSLGAHDVRFNEEVVKVSIVGLGMRSHAGVAARMFKMLASEGIDVRAIATSEIRISCLIDAKYLELAVRSLHEGFGLAREPAPA
jgi:aspartate kinase